MNLSPARLVMLAGLLWFASGVASAQTSIDGLLDEADRIRTAEPARFKALVARLDSAAGDATPAQLMKLRLMRSYRSMMSGDLPGAIRELKYLSKNAADIELKYRAGALLANAYAITRDFKEGLETIESTLSKTDDIQSRQVRHYGLLSAGVLYNQVGEYALGRGYAERVLADEASGRSRCIAENLRLEALQGQGDMPDEAAILSAIRQCEAQNEPILAGFSRAYLARKLSAEGKVGEAIELLEKYLPEVEKTGYARLILEYHSMLAEYRMEKGDIQGAEGNAKNAIEQGASLASSLPLVIAYKTLYDIAVTQEDPVKALDYYRRYAEADKAYMNDVKSREMAYQIVRHQSLQQSQEIALLNRENEVLQLQQRINEQEAQTQRLLILLLLLLVGSVGYWAFKVKRVQVSLRRMAETDALTGICNRHHFTQQSAQTLMQSARAGEDVALVMFDLDHFKSINDRFGHDVGDWVLKRVTETCKTFCRRIDHLGRIGGEEFAILLSGCDLRGATRVAEDCRVRIASLDTQSSGHKFLVTASFGVTASSLSGYDLAKLLSHADKMLYRAKREGRNRVASFEGDLQQWLQLQPVPDDGQEAGQGADATAAESVRALNS